MCHTLLSWKGVGWNFRCCEYADRFRWCFPCFWKKRWSPKKQQTKQSKLVSIMGFTSCIMRFTSCLTRTAWTSHLPVGLGVMIQGFYTTLQCESPRLSGSLSQEPSMKNQQTYKKQAWEYDPQKQWKKHQAANHQNCTKTAERWMCHQPWPVIT